MPKEFTVLEGTFSIHRFPRDEPVPAKVYSGSHFWIGKTGDELSIVCESSINIKSEFADHGWSVIKLIGPFELNTIGIVSEVSAALAKENISIFVQSTYDTDYILVKEQNINTAISALKLAGYYYKPQRHNISGDI